MTDLSKFKRKGGLGAPPPITEASGNLDAPESAPVAPVEALPPAKVARRNAPRRVNEVMKDGRSARRTGRTLQFATRVSEEFDSRLREIAVRDGLLLVEVLERALDAYEAEAAHQGQTAE